MGAGQKSVKIVLRNIWMALKDKNIKFRIKLQVLRRP